jgi:hypothetical protein
MSPSLDRGRGFHLLAIISLFLSSSHAQYYTPPLGEVALSNQNIDLNQYNQSMATDALVTISFGPSFTRDFLVSSSVDAAGMSSEVDGGACPVDGLTLLFARGIQADPLAAKQGGVDANCTESTAQSLGARCDFDLDQCPEYIRNVTADYGNASVDFSFNNITESVSFSSERVAVPDGILDAMRDSSGADGFNVSLSGSIRVSYLLIDPTFSDGICSEAPRAESTSIPAEFSRSFRIYGRNRLFFLLAPALNEQWHLNNRFDMIVLSQAPIYHAELSRNGNLTKNISMKEFHIDNGPYGLRQIVSFPYNYSGSFNLGNASNQSNSTNATMTRFNLSQPGVWAEIQSDSPFTPAQLESDQHPFGFVYEFNSTYEGMGINNLSIMVWDACGRADGYNASLNSRMLSYNGSFMENGSPINANISRGSAPFQQDILGRSSIAIGLVAVVLVLSFVNFWALR